MKEKLLYVTHRVPYPPDKGDKIRTYNILRHLSQHFAVDLLVPSDETPRDEDLAHLRTLTSNLTLIPFKKRRLYQKGLKAIAKRVSITECYFANRSVGDAVRQAISTGDYKAVLFSSSAYGDIIKRLPDDVPVITDMTDVDSEKWREYSETARLPLSWVYRREHKLLRKLEQEITARSRFVSFVSEEETELFKQSCPVDNAIAVKNGVDYEYFDRKNWTNGKHPKPACVFVGALDYKPNVDACVWFVREVWPKVVNLQPEALFHIVGRDPVDEVHALGDVPGVEVIGPVPDVRPWLWQSRVSVSPMRIARGVQNKVLEAFAAGTPVIASNEAITGIAATPQEHFLPARTPEEWADAVLALLHDSALGDRLATAAAQYVREHHSWDACLSRMSNAIREINSSA